MQRLGMFKKLGLCVPKGYICGSMEALNVPSAKSSVFTFWEGEIVDSVNFTFHTKQSLELQKPQGREGEHHTLEVPCESPQFRLWGVSAPSPAKILTSDGSTFYLLILTSGGPNPSPSISNVSDALFPSPS
eukprot:1181902-Prorocentrum_minimum.AAC.6